MMCYNQSAPDHVGLKALRCRIDILGTIKGPLPFLC